MFSSPKAKAALNALKSAGYTALWTFGGSVAMLSLGWLSSVAKWASANGHAPLPGLSVIGYAVVGAAVSAGSGVVAGLVRFAQSQNLLPGTPPQFGAPAPTPAGVGPTDSSAVTSTNVNDVLNADGTVK